ncbi:MAG: AbrB/MazE/SpoVT family DNA-binding domain-containing protein [Gammaproteobacteria bacterium]|nr:AbrB/MazE/SpoVT family DNA-binding domain-containing protein [Gammaproteobacteria bacterium]
MATATLSSKFQLAIPKATRDSLGLRAGQKFVVLEKNGVIELVPQISLGEARGMLAGVDASDYRDRSDRV